MEGYSCTCFAYGQTGSGKTHTLTGPPQDFLLSPDPDPLNFGLIPRSFVYLYQRLKENHQATIRIHVSYFEIYNEQVIDLLNPHPMYPLNVRWDKRRKFYVDNLFVIECDSVDDLMAVMETGMKNRACNATNPNEYSSRSHSMLTVMIDSETSDPDNAEVVFTKHGKLTFVDLAGSEKVKDGIDLSAEQLQETNNINRSLLVLGNCISALSEHKKKPGHIPYRDSKLTKLLADSLGGSGITLMIGCVSPSSSSVTETMNTMRYAFRARKIRNQPAVQLDPPSDMLEGLKQEIKRLQKENEALKRQRVVMETERSRLDTQRVQGSTGRPLVQEPPSKLNNIKEQDRRDHKPLKAPARNGKDLELTPRNRVDNERHADSNRQRNGGDNFYEAPRKQGKDSGRHDKERNQKFDDHSARRSIDDRLPYDSLEIGNNKSVSNNVDKQKKGGRVKNLYLPSPRQDSEPYDDSPTKGFTDEDTSLYEMLQEFMVENEGLRSENSNLHKVRDKFQSEHEQLMKENQQMSRKLDELKRQIDMQRNEFQQDRQNRYDENAPGNVTHPKNRVENIGPGFPPTGYRQDYQPPSQPQSLGSQTNYLAYRYQDHGQPIYLPPETNRHQHSEQKLFQKTRDVPSYDAPGIRPLYGSSHGHSDTSPPHPGSRWGAHSDTAAVPPAAHPMARRYGNQPNDVRSPKLNPPAPLKYPPLANIPRNTSAAELEEVNRRLRQELQKLDGVIYKHKSYNAYNAASRHT